MKKADAVPPAKAGKSRAKAGSKAGDGGKGKAAELKVRKITLKERALSVERKREKIEAIRKIVADSKLTFSRRYTGPRSWRVKFYDIDPGPWSKVVLPKITALDFVEKAEIRKNSKARKDGRTNVASLVAYLV